MPKQIACSFMQYTERKECSMQYISREYTILFNAITEAEKDLHRLRERLMLAQQLAEECYISQDQEDLPPD